jgi:arabinoxylan arabinofuranohydrolase
MSRWFPSVVSMLLGVAALLGSAAGWADNPIIQTKYTADPAPLVHEDTLYLYTTHDEDTAVSFEMYDWMLYSTTDMVNWRDHGVVAGVRDPYKTFAWSDGRNAWAPQAIERDGKFYLYCPTVRNGHMDIGVAVADSPTGPFVDAIGDPLIHTESTHDIDPSVFIDDDGQAYLYWGHQHLYYVTLNADMVSYSGQVVELPRPDLFEEGPWIYKRNGLYYLAFASYCCPEGIGYATSDSPIGPWTSQGHIMEPVPIANGNHPGIVDYRGTTYVFGFSWELLWARQSEQAERRSVSVDIMNYAADGTIPTLPFWSEEGPPQIEALDPYTRVEAETIAWAWEVQTEPCSEGGMNVTSIEAGDYIKVKGVDFGAGAVSFEASVASEQSDSAIEIRLNDVAGQLVGTCSVPATGGWQTWSTTSCAVDGAEGVHDLFFVFTGGSGALTNFDWWRFAPAEVTGTGGRGGASSAGAGPGGGGAETTGGSEATGGVATGGLSTGGVATGGVTPVFTGGVGGGVTGGVGTGGVGTGGGAAATGGATGGPNTGGMPTATGGVTGTGGAGALPNVGMTGGVGAGGAPPASGSASDDGGCGCRAGGRAGPTAGFALWALLVACVVRRRRPRRSSRSGRTSKSA